MEGRIGGRDGLKELRERVEDLRGAYEEVGRDGLGYVDGDEDEEGARGTDEEWDDQGGEEGDDDLDWD